MVPEHWQQLPLKRLVRTIEQGWSPECESWPATGEEWGVLKVGCVNGGSFRPEENKALPVTLEPRPELAVCKGDVLVSRANTRELVGSCVAAPQDYPSLLLCDKIYRIRAGERVTPEFLAALITVHGRRAVEIEATGASSSMLNISQSVILDLPVALPEPAEQDQIMAAATRETARIDTLVAKKTRFIELLREKRQALITHAVTKGLDPNVKMKDSGVEWLGVVPEHWTVGALKNFWQVTDCKHLTAEFVDDGYPLASIREVQGKFVNLENAKRTTKVFYLQLIEGGRCPQAGDLIFSRNATVGEVAQVGCDQPEFAMGQDVCLLRRKQTDISSDYLQAVLRSPVVIEQLQILMVGATFKRVNVDDIRNLLVPMPPAGEQLSIADFIGRRAGRIESLLNKTERSITLLKERRSALISAAVTGQIDLREAV
jgi:type I restriction enzyme S subunit